MSDDSFPTFDEAEVPAKPDAPKIIRRRPRWQVTVLVVGIALVVGAIIFGLVVAPPPDPSGPLDIAFSETQTYSEAVVGQPQWVNPLLAVSQADRDLTSLVFSGLTRIDEYGQPVGDLAESWTVSPDGLTVTFHLRSGITWHDGAPFTADDVAFTMSLLRDSAFPGPQGLGRFWQTVETYADDPATVRFILTQPLAAFPEYAGIGILPVHVLGGIRAADLPNDPFNLAPIGTGRMRWASIERPFGYTTVQLQPYAGYYNQARIARVSTMELRFYTNTNSAFNALSQSEVQAMGGLTLAQLDSARPSKNLNLYTARQPSFSAIIFNQAAPNRLPFFTDPVIRRALGMALDKSAIAQEALPRQALPAASTVLPGTWAFDAGFIPTPFDPAGASAQLDATGWPLVNGTRAHDTTRLTFRLLAADTPVDRQVGQLVVDAWKALGIDVSLQVVSPEQLITKLSTPSGDQGRDFDAALVEFGQGGLADPDPYAFWHESQISEGQNYSGLADRDISELLESARKDGNGVRRAELYRQFQRLFDERGAAIILYNPLYHYAMSCQVQGEQLMLLADPSDRFRNLHEWRILPPAQAAQACSGS